VLQQSAKRWPPNDRAESPQLANRRLAAGYLETLGKFLTIALRDGERLVAAEACIVHRQELILWTTFRDRHYDYHGLGNRLMDLAYHWAKANGLAGIDIGGGFIGYKRRWAPEASAKTKMLISPFIDYLQYRVRRAMSSAWSTVAGKFEKLLAAIFAIGGILQKLQEDGFDSLALTFLAT
jgi:CelD/BcsL family acetyltransferase involved in cellulose biosynthesis